MPVGAGHLLIEDIPGVGKTTLAHTLVKLLGMQYQRIQFTSDILPADIIGASVFDAKNHEFKFHAGPIFNQMVLADEINRSTPKAQSALLEAMEESSKSLWKALLINYPSLSLGLPHKIPRTRSALSPCRNRNSTAF